MKPHVLAALIFLFFFSLVFAASGTSVTDGNIRVDLVYITEIGDSNLSLGDGNRIDMASDDLTTGTFESADENGVRVGVFFSDFELVKYKLFITITDPKCYLYNSVNVFRFNIYSELGQPIGDINYTLNGHPGLDLNGYCFGTDSNKTCQRIDPNIIPFVTNTITVLATNGLNIQYATCDFNIDLTDGNIIIIQQANMGLIFLFIVAMGLIVLFVLSRRRR